MAFVDRTDSSRRSIADEKYLTYEVEIPSGKFLLRGVGKIMFAKRMKSMPRNLQ